MRNGNFLKMCVSEIRVKRIGVNQGLEMLKLWYFFSLSTFVSLRMVPGSKVNEVRSYLDVV